MLIFVGYLGWSVIGMMFFTDTSLLLKSYLLTKYRFENISREAKFKVTCIGMFFGLFTTIDVGMHWYELFCARWIEKKREMATEKYRNWLFK